MDIKTVKYSYVLLCNIACGVSKKNVVCPAIIRHISRMFRMSKVSGRDQSRLIFFFFESISNVTCSCAHSVY